MRAPTRGYTVGRLVGGRTLALRVVLPLDSAGLADERASCQLRNGVSPSFARSAERSKRPTGITGSWHLARLPQRIYGV